MNSTQFPRAALGAYAQAYREAANQLVQRLGSTTNYRDVDACPIVFLYRHAVELRLKEIVHWGNALLYVRGLSKTVRPNVLFRTHDLCKLVSAAKPIFGIFRYLGDWNGSEFLSFDDFERFVAELNEFDPGSYAFRYPIDHNGASSLRDQLCFNVVTFGRKLNSLLSTIDGVATMTYENFQAEAAVAIGLN
ncbi:MAG TPA: hypothetical protein VJO35_18645 [Terriglobales bacterium]|nr:hypothetical protein [Terriglobales bacterium]